MEKEQHVSKETTIFWLRRDLRLEDNAGLYYALKENKQVLPVFIFDTKILDKLENKVDARVEFIYQSLVTLKAQLEEEGSSLLVLHGNPVCIYQELHPQAVYTNHDYEPYTIQRDEAIRANLSDRNILFKSFKDQVIFEKDEVLKDNGKPYTVFTPYSKKWKTHVNSFFTKSYPNEKYFQHLKKVTPISMPSLEDIGFKKSTIKFPERIIHQDIINTYGKTRDFPGIQGTTRLSVHLRFGTISIRKLVQIALKKNETWLNELIWREFYMMILYHFPQVVTEAFKPSYDQVEWRNNVQEFQAWCHGQTGYPIVDAGMRELNTTGYMHNRVRMITASFLVKHLLIDWRWGEAYFAKKLLDYDLAANNGGWQWSAGCGCDAAPYFRVFNPELQTKKFDADWKYIRKWVPEVGSANYAKPIVDHTMARNRVLEVYKKAIISN